MDFMMNFLETLGTIAFAVSGAIEAMKKQMDLLGVIVLGMVTAIGGGVIRDIVTGEIPPIAFQNPTQAKVAIVVSIVVFFLAMFLTRHDILTNVSWANAVLFISDAMGLAAFTILGIRFVQEVVDGSLSLLLVNQAGIYAARDRLGRTPVVVGKKDEGFCVSFENFAYKNLGYADYKELGPGEIVVLTEKNCITLAQPGKDMKICTFLWVYYGYPASSYEGISVEQMRYNCGAKMAQRDHVKPDIVAGVPDSGTAHAVGYANESGIPFSRPFIKYTPTWPRSFMPTMQSKRNLIAKMKMLAVNDLIKDKSILLIDDSIVRGTQLRETTEYLYESGAKEVHIRPACPPLLYGCKYLNFSRSSSEMDLIARRVIERLENGQVTEEILQEYADPESEKYEKMVEEIGKELKFTSLRFNRLDDMLEATGLEPCKLCTYCWNGKE